MKTRLESLGLSWVIFAAITLLGGHSAWGLTTRTTPLQVGYSSNVFVDVDVEDAKTVAKLWTDMLTKQSGYNAGASVTIYQDTHALEKEIRGKQIDLLLLTAHEFVRIKHRMLFDPILVPEIDQGIYEEMVLLTRKDKTISSFNDLRQKPVVVPKGLFMTACQLWIETCLMREGVVSPRSFFSALREVKKPSQAVFQVFFGQAEACLVSRNALTTMAELNPQLGKELVAPFTSPGIPGGIISVRKNLDESERKDAIETLSSMHKSPQGKQLLTFFKKKKLVPYKEEYLRGIEDLVKEHGNLESRLSRSGQ